MLSNQIIHKSQFRGAKDTVEQVAAAALKAQHQNEIRRCAERICKDLRSKDYVSEALAVYNWLWVNTRYMRDPRTIERIREPLGVIRDIERGFKPSVDCDDLTATLAALLLAVGCKVQIITFAFKHAFFNGERQFSHIALQVHEPRSGVWITLDPVANVATAEMRGRVVAARIWPIA